jgi:hypothetical protein
MSSETNANDSQSNGNAIQNGNGDDGLVQRGMREFLGRNWRMILRNWRTTITGGITLVCVGIIQHPEWLRHLDKPMGDTVWDLANIIVWISGGAFVLSTKAVNVGGVGSNPPSAQAKP